MSGGQRCLRRKADVAHVVGRPQDGRSRTQTQSYRATRLAKSLETEHDRSDATSARRLNWRGLYGARAVLQMARHDWQETGWAVSRRRGLRFVDRPRAEASL